MSNIQLVSFKLCPYVRRSVITLLKKNVEFDISYIDLANKPDWFLKISPLGKVPVLKVGDDVLFESAVINEYLDEINPPSLHPSDPLEKAQNRAWIEFVSNVFTAFFQMCMARDEDTMNQHSKSFKSLLQILENKLQGPYFDGETFSLVDSALIPGIDQFDILERRFGYSIFTDLPKLSEYRDEVLQLEYVKKSVVDDHEELFVGYMKNATPVFAKSYPPAS